MNVLIDTIKMVLPVIICLLIGFYCKKSKLLSSSSIEAIKSIIGSITLPVVLFGAFFNADYSLKMLLVFVVIYLCCSIAMGFGFLTRKALSPYGKFYPFLVTGFEGGMLGYALFKILMGGESGSIFAVADIGQTVFAYTIFLAVLLSVDGQKISAKGIFKNMFTNKAFLGMLFGIILGATGLAPIIKESSFGGILTELVSFISAPNAFLILIVVGFELSFKKELLKPILKASGMRFLIMASLLIVSSLIIFSIIPFDFMLFMALVVLFSLPAPFITPIFADTGESGEFIGGCYSFYTLITIIIFIILSVLVNSSVLSF